MDTWTAGFDFKQFVPPGGSSDTRPKNAVISGQLLYRQELTGPMQSQLCVDGCLLEGQLWVRRDGKLFQQSPHAPSCQVVAVCLRSDASGQEPMLAIPSRASLLLSMVKLPHSRMMQMRRPSQLAAASRCVLGSNEGRTSADRPIGVTLPQREVRG